MSIFDLFRKNQRRNPEDNREHTGLVRSMPPASPAEEDKPPQQESYEAIMKKITSGLSGQPDIDINYLRSQSRKYKDHPMGREITRACGRLIYDLLPKDAKEKWEQTVESSPKTFNTALEEIRSCIRKKNFEKALELSEALVKKTDEHPLFQNESIKEYYTFHELFEELLFTFYHKPEKGIRATSVPFSDIYFQHGSLLLELKRYSEAQEILEKARRWNPVSTRIAFSYAETYRALGDMERFWQLTKETLQYAFKRQDLARCYRNLGYYFTEKKQYHEAAGCYLMSEAWDRDNPLPQSELKLIQSKAPQGFQVPSPGEFRKYGEKYGFPTGFPEDILELANSCGKRFFQNGQKEEAVYCLKIMYHITHDEKTKEIIEKIESQE